jgi:hypothetical protein
VKSITADGTDSFVGDLPIEQSDNFTLVISLKTAAVEHHAAGNAAGSVGWVIEEQTDVALWPLRAIPLHRDVSVASRREADIDGRAAMTRNERMIHNGQSYGSHASHQTDGG